MLNNIEINPFFKNSIYSKGNNNLIKNSNELICPINYTWKKLLKMMNKINLIWHMKKYDNTFLLDSQSLNKFIYSNLKYCKKVQNLRLKNNILESDLNSYFQTNLFDFLSEEQGIYDSYDELFKKKQYIPKKDENEEMLFGEFVVKYKEYFYSIQKNKKSMRQLKKLRWYLILDKDNFFEEESKENIFNINNNQFFIDFNNEVENNNDSFDEIETKIAYNEFIKNEKNKVLDNLEEVEEKNIINDELINKLLNNEKNPFFFIIKLIFLSIKIFCKSAICHLLNYFSNVGENKYIDGKNLINEYLLCFNNFVDSCLLINKKCMNINITMNYLYEELFKNYPNFPKFSIFRMCIRIWFEEANTLLIGKNSLLSEIRNKLTSMFATNLKEELFNKMEENLKNKNSFNSKSVNYDKSKSFNLTGSFMLFKSDNSTFKKKDYSPLFGFGSEYINTYDDSDKQYKILDKGLSIINDTFSNEYSVYLLNLSSIDINTFYDELISNFNNSISYYISSIFNDYLNDNNYNIKDIIDNILDYFDNYFYKTRIIPHLRKSIYDKVYSEVKNNLLEFIKNKYLDNDFEKNKKLSISYNKSNNSSIKTTFSSNLNAKSFLKSSIFGFNDDLYVGNFDDGDSNNETFKKDIIKYIIKNLELEGKSIFNEVERKIEEINEHINIYDSFESLEKWNESHSNMIKRNDQKVMEELINLNMRINVNINIPLSFNKFKRYLLSYSLHYDWAFIKKVKNVEKYSHEIDLNGNDNIEMDLDNNINNDDGLNYFNNLNNIGNINNNDYEIGLNYFNNLDNINNSNNNSNNGGLNLRSSFFDY